MLFDTWGCGPCAQRPGAPRWRTFFTPYTFTAADVANARDSH